MSEIEQELKEKIEDLYLIRKRLVKDIEKIDTEILGYKVKIDYIKQRYTPNE